MTDDDHQPITLDTLAGGAAGELFLAAVAEVIQNIRDVNMDAKAKRTITLTVSFAPNDERDIGRVTIACSTKLAGMKGVETTVYIGQHHGQLIAVEPPQQRQLFTEPEARPRAVPTPEIKETTA